MARGNVVLITGSSAGFGRLMAETLARKKYLVFATMRDVAGFMEWFVVNDLIQFRPRAKSAD